MARLLLDENFPRGAASALESAGHDLVRVAEVAPGLDDLGILALARAQDRALLTFDADFGDLLFKRGAPPPPAVLLFRLHPIVNAEVARLALAALQTPPKGVFGVVSRDTVRWRPMVAGSADGAG